MAQPFDLAGLELEGEAVPLVEQILEVAGAALSIFAVSERGELVYQTGSSFQETQLVWKDRSGADAGPLGEPADQRESLVSADGAWVATSIAADEGRSDIWIYDVSRNLRTRFTFEEAGDLAPIWSPDGARIAFSSDREHTSFNLYLKEVGGTGAAELIFASEMPKVPYSWTPDGKMILFTEFSPQGGGGDLYAVPVDGDREPISLIDSEFREEHPTVSPDGRWLAYSSNESGRREVYVTTFPHRERKWQVSVEGGRQPKWTKGGSEIVYIDENYDALHAVEVSAAAGTFNVGAVTKLFDVELRPDPGRDWDVTADGERFLLNSVPQRARVSALHLVVNWPAILEGN